MAEIYFRFSAESFVIKRPHTQYMIPVLQWLRHTLHCHFGSTLTISEISMFPASMIAFFDSALNALNDCCLSRSFWTASCCGWRVILRINWRMLKFWETFHRFVRNAGDVEVNVPIVRRKVKLIRFITTFEMTIFLHCVLFFLSIRFPWSIVISDMLFFLCRGFPRSIGRTELFLQLTNNLLGYGFPRTIFNGF